MLLLLLLLETSEVGGRSIKALAPPQLHTERDVFEAFWHLLCVSAAS